MIRWYCAFFVFFLFTAAPRAIAQPTLPDIEGIVEDGMITLRWNNQYDKVKAITIMRSHDSLSDYEIIGYVKKRDKGIQSFTDDDPLPGKNYYKLSLLFNSGLTWRSNFTMASADEPNEHPKPVAAPKEAAKKPKLSQLESTFVDSVRKKMPDTCKTTANRAAVNISFEADPAMNTQPAPPRPKIKLTYDEAADNTPIFIRSKYIYTDTLTGHVSMSLPDDMATHSYSVKFFDKDKRLITEVPKINSQKILIDKRNFQRKGVYQFRLRKDYLELESGFIVIDPAPNP
ncbi:MAG: hypothetical protein K0Q79_428 [Flavipsychrobacter sp.]|jgi:hypothetical protein|nr:hypothetical protein [Flavipsychrobacter sp.]